MKPDGELDTAERLTGVPVGREVDIIIWIPHGLT
jgi:hypothetical protein